MSRRSNPDKLADDETLALSSKVDVSADPEMDLRRYDYPAARVTVSLNDGRTLSESVIAHHGDHRNPAPAAELANKFAFLSADFLGERGVGAVTDVVSRLEESPEINELTDLLRGE